MPGVRNGMVWPTPQDYNEAVQNPRTSFCDAELRAGAPDLTSLGLPRPITGNFASVYRFRGEERECAVRCFWRGLDDQQQHYAAISDHLEARTLPYTVGFEYLAKGISLRGTWYPVLKMDWVEGELLNECIRRNLGNARALRELARRWIVMVETLERTGIAHGDLQHGNVFVVDGDFKLVDYDGMFVPALAGRTSAELGHEHYQHPRRSGADFGPGLDRFSAWVVYLSLVMLAIDPELWVRLGAGDERLLFTGPDFARPDESAALTTLGDYPDPRVRFLAGRLRSLLTLQPLLVPPLEDLAGGAAWRRGSLLSRLLPWQTPAAKDSVPPSGRPRTARAPDWLEEHLLDRTRQAPRTFTSFPTMPRACLGLFTALMLAILALLRQTSLVAEAATCAGLFGVLQSALLIALFRRDPVVAEKRGLLVSQRDQLRALQALHQVIREAERTRRRLEADYQKKEQRAARARLRIAAKEQSRRADVQRTLREIEQYVGLAAGELDRRERAVVAGALKALQARHLERGLQSYRLRSSRIDGASRRAKLLLWSRGLRTAADINSRNLPILNRMDDRLVRALIVWRATAQAEVRGSLPHRLPAPHYDAVTRRYRKQKDGLRAALGRAEDSARALQTAVAALHADSRATVEGGLRSAAMVYAENCSAIVATTAAVRSREPGHYLQLAEIRQQLAAFGGISFSRYVRFVLMGR